MDPRETGLLDAMFKKLEKVTNGFVQEGGIFFGTRHISGREQPRPIVQRIPKWFRGFTAPPGEYIQAKIKARHPEAGGTVIFFLIEDYLWYSTDFKQQ